MGSLEQEIRRILATGGERKAHTFLKKYPLLVINAFSRAWNAKYCVPEFRIGTEFRSDFLILSADSVAWHASFVELESPSARLYLKDGTPSKTLRVAERQISDWRNWERINDHRMRQLFSKTLRENDSPAWCSHADRHQRGETEILDPNTFIHYYYHVVIGRRDLLSEDERRWRAQQDAYWGGPEIATYDRIVDTARRLDKAREFD